MAKDLANIEATKRALEDLRDMRDRWNRILSQLDLYYTRTPQANGFPKTQEWAMEQLQKINQTSDVLEDHREALEKT